MAEQEIKEPLNQEPESKNPWFLYLIRCGDDSLYCGITSDVNRRFAEHQEGGKKTAKYLRGRGPLKLVFQQQVGDKSAALKMELKMKALSKQEKEDVVTKGHFSIEEQV